FILATLLLPKSYSHLGVPLSIIINVISFLIIHVLENKGFVMARCIQTTIEVSTLWQPQVKTILKKLLELLPTPSNIAAYSRDKVNIYGAPYILFGVLFAIN